VSAANSRSEAATVQMDRFQGGRQWLMAGGGLGLVLTLATFGGVAMDPVAGWASYLVAFAYWSAIAMASVIMLQIFHATRAKWMIVLKRPVEIMGSTVPLFILLFIPIAFFGLKTLYSWVEPASTLSRETLHLLHNKRPWLNPGFFIGRGFFYLVFVAFVHQRLFGWSKKQDVSGDIALTQKQRNLGAGSLPLIGLAFTFAAFDWLMSLNPTWFSTVFGVYLFGGSFVSAMSILAIITHHGRGKDSVGVYVTAEHTHNIGKLMLAFTCFWTYIAFSQLLLIWIAGLPEETPFYITRFNPGWRALGIFLIPGHFFLPFAALLSRSLKRDSKKLAAVAVWILLVHFVDIYWLVMPTFYPEGVQFHWTTITAGVGIGLLTVAFGIARLRGTYALPVKDPYLADSLRYKQP
jgi:hypothetical protein